MQRFLPMVALAALVTSAPLFAQRPAPAPRPGTVHHRAVHQQHRIAIGVRSGQLTPRETRRLERREARIHREVRRDRRANGGRLTPQQRRHVNRQQNRVSRQIYRDKHNGRVRR